MPCGMSVGFSRYSGDNITVILLKVALNIITLAIQIRDKAPLDYYCDVLIYKSDHAEKKCSELPLRHSTPDEVL